MEYPLMDPPFEIIPFDEMKKKEAKRYFDWFMEQIPHRLDLLRRAYEHTNGGKQEDLDFSPESLILLWKWFAPRAKLEEVPKVELAGYLSTFENPTLRAIVEEKEKYRIDLPTQTLVLDIGIYYGEVWARNHQLTWGFLTKPKSYVDVNRPILVELFLEPRGIIHTIILKELHHKSKPDALFNNYLYWVENQLIHVKK